MKIGFEIAFENEKMIVHAPNLFTYEEDIQDAMVTRHDSRRIDSSKLLDEFIESDLYNVCLTLARRIGKEVQE